LQLITYLSTVASKKETASETWA